LEIYCIIITKPSGDKSYYIGQTKYTSEIRFKSHISGKQLVDRKIREYGIDFTELRVLVRNIQTQKELDWQEQLHIQLFKSYAGWKKGGYNLTLGGNGVRSVEIDPVELQMAVDAGMSMTQICVKFGGISRSTLYRWMKTYKIKRKNICEVHRKNIEKLIYANFHLLQISNATGISRSTLSKFCRANRLLVSQKSEKK